MDLSIFVDESGDFDINSKHSPYYIFSLIIHNQKNSIEREILRLDRHMEEKKFSKHAIHTAPLIRQEKPYEFYNYEERKVLFNQLYYFAKDCDIKYHSFVYEKKEFVSSEKMISKMAQELAIFIRDNLQTLMSFDTVKIYYNNGQNYFMLHVIGGVNIQVLTGSDTSWITNDDVCILEIKYIDVDEDEEETA